jgi:anti-sigma regulatory factor (Ser/Thr protein kinase)
VEIVRTLSLAPTAPSEARFSLRAFEGTLLPGQLDELRLVVSELVTNSVIHSGLKEGESIQLSVQVLVRSIRVEVVDSGCGFPEADAPKPPPGRQGWGLPIVDALADRWGTERGPNTKVWAEFALQG